MLTNYTFMTERVIEQLTREMENYFLEGTAKTPNMDFDPETGVFEISGRSIPENSVAFYRPLLDWLDVYVKSPGNTPTFLNISLEYFNTSSSKCLVEIFRRMEILLKSGRPLEIKWYYEAEDQDILEAGRDFNEFMNIPIELVLKTA